jgi:hypothetical protein
MEQKPSKEELKMRLRSKTAMLNMKRTSKIKKEYIMDNMFKNAGINKEEFEKNLQALNGGMKAEII